MRISGPAGHAAWALVALGWGGGLPVAAAPAVAPAFWSYAVQPGDTLIAIARAQLDPAQPAAGWRGLQRLNRIAEPRRLQPGQLLRIPLDWLRPQPQSATVLHAHGAVQLQRGSEPPQPLRPGMALHEGDRLQSADGASATLRLADGSRLLLRPASTLTLQRLQARGASGRLDSRLQLQRGALDSRLTPAPAAGGGPRYELVTPSAQLGVRGTEFRTSVDEAADRTRLEVLAGTVATGRGAAAAVGAGFGVLLRGGVAEAAPSPLAAAPDLAGLPALVERLPLRLRWPAVAGAPAYRAQVLAADDDERLLRDGRFAEPQAQWTLPAAGELPDGRYQLRVRVVDGRGLEGRDARAGFVLKARPEPPFIRQPAADAVLYGDAVDFAWTAVDGAARYRLQVADRGGAAAAADFTAPRVDVELAAATAHRLPLPPGDHVWRLASQRADGDRGPWGDAQALTLRALPPPPVLGPPALGDDALALRWPAGEEAGTRYEVQLARDRDFASLVAERRVDRPEAVFERPPAGRYLVRIRSIDRHGQPGPWGAPQQLELPPQRPWWWLLPPLLLLLVF